MHSLIKPHGSESLEPRLCTGEAWVNEMARAESLPKVPVSSRELGDLIMLGIGGFTPLTGFMGEKDWRSVCENMQLANGLFWPIPITLSCDPDLAKQLKLDSDVALVDPQTDAIVGVLNLQEKYSIDPLFECQKVFGTTDEKHPGVKMVMSQGAINLGGCVNVLSQGDFPKKYPGIYLTPQQTRDLLVEKGWKTVAAFQTRNPMHRSHEYLAKIAIEICDGVLIHSLLGNLKEGDIPADVRQEAIGTLIDHYFVKDTVVQAGYPLDMRYAGPREALLHALFRQNYGCTHLIVGRDHAGVGDYYGPFDAQHIFDEIPADAMLIKPLKIDWTFWCHACGGMASTRTCPHEPKERVLISGTQLRNALSADEPVSTYFSRPEVLAVLGRYYQSLKN
jgi:sulfate adenylyltransferase